MSRLSLSALFAVALILFSCKLLSLTIYHLAGNALVFERRVTERKAPPLDADGVAVLDYGQAQRAARAWWRAELRREEGHDMRSGPYTVADAIADYLKEFEGRGGKSVYETRRAARRRFLFLIGPLVRSALEGAGGRVT